MTTVLESNIPNLPLRRGKVRDVYDLGESLLIVASDRLSAFDVVLPTGIPDKGSILTQLSNFWFGFLSARTRHHLLKTEVKKFPAFLQPYAEQLDGRAVIVKKTAVVPIECIVRGYLAGSGWKEYKTAQSVCGVPLPAGLKQCDRLPEPIFTPTTKAEKGHDEAVTFEQAGGMVGLEVMRKLRDKSIALYAAAADYARSRGIIIADTKFEWGLLPGSSDPILIDEALTPDSSRFWPAASYEAGRDQESFDKQYVRNYLETLTWDKTPPGPALPEEVVTNTRYKYAEAYEKITGKKFK